MCFYRIDSVVRTCSDKRNWNYFITVNLNAELEGAMSVINITAAHYAFSVEHRASAALARYGVTNRVVLRFSSSASDVNWRPAAGTCDKHRGLLHLTVCGPNTLTRDNPVVLLDFPKVELCPTKDPCLTRGRPTTAAFNLLSFPWCDDNIKMGLTKIRWECKWFYE